VLLAGTATSSVITTGIGSTSSSSMITTLWRLVADRGGPDPSEPESPEDPTPLHQEMVSD
jgi:hypothetical protein